VVGFKKIHAAPSVALSGNPVNPLLLTGPEKRGSYTCCVEVAFISRNKYAVRMLERHSMIKRIKHVLFELYPQLDSTSKNDRLICRWRFERIQHHDVIRGSRGTLQCRLVIESYCNGGLSFSAAVRESVVCVDTRQRNGLIIRQGQKLIRRLSEMSAL
jgi:hypothetical protein